MARPNPVREMYRWVVDDVIRSVRAEFESEGVDESVLFELQRLWEGRLAASGALGGVPPTQGTGYEVPSYTRQHLSPAVVPPVAPAVPKVEPKPEVKEAAPASAPAPAAAATEAKADGEEEIDELDDSDLDISEEEIETDDILICQYDKVRRVKTKWSCVFRDGLLHVNGQDHVFHEAKCEFHF